MTFTRPGCYVWPDLLGSRPPVGSAFLNTRIDLRVGPILDAESQLLFSFCCQKIVGFFFPLAKSEISGLSFCENNSLLIIMKQMTRVYPGLSQGFATILCALTAAPPGGYFMCCTVFTDLSESILTNSIVFQSGSVLCFQLQFISTHDQIVCVCMCVNIYIILLLFT